MEQLKLNMIPNGVNPVFHASQYDKGRQIRFVLDETLSGAEVTVSYRAKDGTEYGNVQMSISGNTITDTIPEEVLTDYGIIEGEVKIDGIGSLNFFVEVEKDAYDGGVITTQTATGAIATFETNIETAFVSLKSGINPVQDLHGYSKPWSGGGGKNKLQITEATQTINGITFTISSDGTITTSGTFTVNAACVVTASFLLKAGTYILNGCPSGGSYSKYVLRIENGSAQRLALDTGNGEQFTLAEDTLVWCRIYIYSQDGIGKTFKPMVRLATESDSSFVPYSNICPISGFSALNVTRTGVNLGNFQNGYGIDASGNVVVQNNRASTVTPIIINPSLSYYVLNVSGKRFIYAVFKDNTLIRRIANVTSGTLLDTTNGNKLYVCLYDNVTVETDKPMVVFDNAITTYSPYNGQTATVNFGQTVYGGVCDVTNGKVNVAYAKKKINELTWNYVNIAGSERYYSTSLSTVIEKPTTIDIVSTLKCSCYETVSERQYAQFTSNNIIAVQTTGFIVIRDTNYTSVSDLLNAVGEQEICYPLATPIEITTTPENLTALSGQNNVYGDTNGDTEVEYYIEV